MKRLAWLLCLGLGPLAHAQSESGMYIGGALGTFEHDEGDGGLISDSTSVYRLAGGYRFNDHFALEVDIGRTGDIEGGFDEFIPGIGDVTLEVDATYDIYAFKVLGLLPFEQWSLLGGVGYYSASVGGSVELPGFGQIGYVDGHERGATASAGIQYDFGLDLRDLSIRGEYQWFDFGSEVDAWGLDVRLLFRF